jgi:lysophospholipase L1-like esterase
MAHQKAETTMKLGFVLGSLMMGSLALVAHSADSTKHWVGTWGAAPYLVESNNMPPSPGLTNNTIRQIVRVSIAGDTVRLKLTNINNAQSVVFKAVHLAVSKGGSAIDVATLTSLKFAGNSSLTLNAGAAAMSDPVAFPLTPSMRVAITINYGATSSNMTGHVASRTPSYLIAGDKSTAADLAGSVETLHWYSIANIDVLAPKSAGAVAIIGNSITDGYGLTDGKQNRWPDMFSEKLLKNATTQEVGVLNMGIGATTVLGTAATAGVVRFQRDILEQPGVRWAIIYHGVNDIGANNAKASDLINGFKTMVTAARAKNLKVYGATLIPFNGNAYYSAAHESGRNEVNTWIRAAGNFDGVIDFDKTMRNPSDATRMIANLSNDWLHPNAEGYKVMGESIDPNLFATATTHLSWSPSLNRFRPFTNSKSAIQFHHGLPVIFSSDKGDVHDLNGQTMSRKKLGQ